ncbi:sensor histidine kinase [Kitasatospora cheerisanensis]|uniref:histidine kinase n=1 Tax=Kitasatospora cheerisanensis KCTC 2395 TaxID=1348663 RepID=A0A066YSE9_9ACTN|nr:histidine kinase [Kitasatospora cheerisanensis]KDN82909.1 putative two-component system sensor kinase [Kitasatospora cheerisanensis KCTC 2395]
MGLRAGWQALVMAVAAGLAVVAPVFAAVFTGVTLVRFFDGGLPLVVPAALLVAVASLYWCVRRGAEWTRRRVERSSGESWRVVYSPRLPLERDERGFWWTGFSYHQKEGVARLVQFVGWALRDQQVRREALWLLVNPVGVLVLIGVPMTAVVSGLVFVASVPVDHRQFFGLSHQGVNLLCSAIIGGSGVAVGLLAMPWAVRAHHELASRVLGGGPRQSRAQLTERVAHLTETRAVAVDAQAAELRRIERDLHDGAQARLVAIGLTLGTIEHLMGSDQTAARELLAEARESSAKALQELRDLVRGIHPPVLAERGLPDAVRELALTSVVPTEVTVSLPGRPEASLETAVYFGVSELLANAAKHARARQVWVDVLHRAGRLRVVVTDDGHGGARMEAGGGLQGIEKRLGTFDGVISLDSPVGGPTTITMELPCVLSSPRISTSFAKA